MESVSRTRFIRISPRKLHLVCELIVGKKVDQALSILEFTPKKAARFVSKTLLSAIANARDQQNVDEDKLFGNILYRLLTPAYRVFLAGDAGQAFAQLVGSSVDVLHKRMTLLDGLLVLAPAGDTRDRTLAEAVRVLSTSSVEREAPAEWFYEVTALVDSVGPGKSKLMEIFRQSGDVSLTLFTQTPH